MIEFSVQVQQWVDTQKEILLEIIKLCAITCSVRLVSRSPVATPAYWKDPKGKAAHPGLFKANWQVTLNSPATTPIELQDPDGSETIERAHEVISQFTFDVDSINFYNCVPYAEVIEYGHSQRQAPYGLVGILQMEWPEIVADSVRAYT